MSGYWACVFCGKPLPAEDGLETECCGEVNHTEWVSDRSGPDYRTAEEYYADQAHEKRRRHLAGED